MKSKTQKRSKLQQNPSRGFQEAVGHSGLGLRKVIWTAGDNSNHESIK